MWTFIFEETHSVTERMEEWEGTVTITSYAGPDTGERAKLGSQRHCGQPGNSELIFIWLWWFWHAAFEEWLAHLFYENKNSFDRSSCCYGWTLTSLGAKASVSQLMEQKLALLDHSRDLWPSFRPTTACPCPSMPEAILVKYQLGFSLVFQMPNSFPFWLPH